MNIQNWFISKQKKADIELEIAWNNEVAKRKKQNEIIETFIRDIEANPEKMKCKWIKIKDGQPCLEEEVIIEAISPNGETFITHGGWLYLTIVLKAGTVIKKWCAISNSGAHIIMGE